VKCKQGGVAHSARSPADDGYVFAFVVVMALFMWLTDKTIEWVLYDLILGLEALMSDQHEREA
jgi:hypothetical protein